VLALSPLIQSFFNFQFEFTGSMFVLFALSSFVYFYGGWPFLSGLVKELKNKRPGMMTLIGLAISVAYIYSGLVVFGLKGKVFFWELVTLIDIMLLGHWIEMKSVIGASRALEELAKLMPKKAHKISEGGSTEDVKVDRLKPSDKVLVKPGEKIPVDGKIIKGESEINEAMITGESKPIQKKKDDSVIGGSVNGSGALTIVVSKTGKDSYLSQVVNLVKEASQSKSKAQGFADRAAFWLTLIAIGAGLITLFSWLFLGKDFVFSLERMVTVMVITCPHALGLAIPLVVAAITSLSAKNGLLIRKRTPFENSRNLDVIVFDKTGTLTKGEFGVTDIINLSDEEDDDQLLAKVASLESNSEHTIARGILKKAKEKELKLVDVEGFEAISGKGAKAKIEGKEIYVGNKELIEELSIEVKDAIEKMDKLAKDGKTAIFAIWDNTVQAIFGLSDIIRDESKEAIAQLKKLGYQVSMITGDNQETAKFVAKELGLDSYFSQVLPDKKSEKINELQEKGKKVAMVGDGVNDAPALAQADVGIAIGAGTDVAAETADIVLVENDPRSVVDAIELSKITYRKTLQNLAWATGYNVFAIPLAAGVLYQYGIVLAPAVGALVMSLSTIIVAINAKLIKFK
ncbi:MAG: cadmium-translocating P-type ATPase, partial [Candidatus Omnitrophica bacterium]|nr:cadmium-translocating P-type ATPase [Candidatus Omnitrophota bacterium]